MVETSSSASLIDLLALRRIVEAEAATRAAALIIDEQLRELDERLVRISNVAEESDGDVKATLDLEFHRAVTDAAGNPVFSALVSALNGTTFHVRASAG